MKNRDCRAAFERRVIPKGGAAVGGLPMHLRVGLRGEQFAARLLRKKGYLLLGSNYHTSLGETDIIAYDPKGRMLCFVEVKTRSPGALNPPAVAVDAEKRRKLINNAAAFLKRMKLPYSGVRFDIAEVILNDWYDAKVNLIENAFGEDAFGLD